MAVLYNLGIDCTDTKKYKTFAAFKKDIEKRGWFFGSSQEQIQGLEDAFTNARRRRGVFMTRCKVSNQFDAVTQFVLENAEANGIDDKTRTFVLCRTEDNAIINAPLGGLTRHATGVCESHSHLSSFCTAGHDRTVVRVPFSRVHGVWWLERGFCDSSMKVDCNFEETQFAGADENEVLADTRGLPIVYGGTVKKIINADVLHPHLEQWEKKKPTKKYPACFSNGGFVLFSREILCNETPTSVIFVCPRIRPLAAVYAFPIPVYKTIRRC